MDFSNLSAMELIGIYGDLLQHMREKQIIRSKNVIGDLGEYLVIDLYNHTKGLPKLQYAPPSTKNIDAISVHGDRYSIKTTSTITTGAFHGLPQLDDQGYMHPLFEYAVIVKLDEHFQTELIIEVPWNVFMKHKHWQSRLQAHTLHITKALIADSRILLQK